MFNSTRGVMGLVPVGLQHLAWFVIGQKRTGRDVDLAVSNYDQEPLAAAPMAPDLEHAVAGLTLLEWARRVPRTAEPRQQLDRAERAQPEDHTEQQHKPGDEIAHQLVVTPTSPRQEQPERGGGLSWRLVRRVLGTSPGLAPPWRTPERWPSGAAALRVSRRHSTGISTAFFCD